MNYIFIASNIDYGKGQIDGSLIADGLLEHSIWLFQTDSYHRKDLEPGDRFIIYIAGKGHRFFIANGVLATKALSTAKEQDRVAEAIGLRRFEYYTRLENVCIWANPRPINNMLETLDFVRDKKNYGLHLRHGVKRISDADYAMIVEQAESD